MRRSFALFLLSSTLILGGCLAVGGSRTNNLPTVGQQLTDLKIAYDQGTMSEEEYDKARKAFLDQASYPPSKR